MVIAARGIGFITTFMYLRHSPQSQVVIRLDDFPQDFLRKLFTLDRNLSGPYTNATVDLTISNNAQALENQNWELEISTRMEKRKFQIAFEKYNLKEADFYRGKIFTLESKGQSLVIGSLMMEYLMNTANMPHINYLGKKGSN